METHLWRILKYKKLWMLPRMALWSTQGIYRQVLTDFHGMQYIAVARYSTRFACYSTSAMYD